MTAPADQGSPRTPRSSALTDEELARTADAPILDPEALDAAIIGTMPTADGSLALVYSYEKLAECLTEVIIEERKKAGVVDDLEEDDNPAVDAQEDLDHNTIPMLAYLGARAPVVLSAVDDELIIETEISPGDVVLYRGTKWVRIR
jgi:hypothetical protein